MTTLREQIEVALPGYEVGDEIGRGGFGVVWAASHRQLRRPVAIKALPPEVVRDADVHARFAAEARVVASLSHPHIVPIYDYVEQENLCLLVMEHLPGGTVWTRFRERGMTMETACAVAMATAAGLDHAHRHGVLHRDVKPDNLLYSADGVLKVTDFGIAKVIAGTVSLATHAGSLLGTPAYMAPEQAEGLDVGPPADVYATGVMFYELLSGQLPFSEEGGPLAILYQRLFEDPRPLDEVEPSVPTPLVEVAMRALARAPADRFPDAEAFGVAVGRAATAVWGPGWLTSVEERLLAPGPILASAGHPPLDATDPVVDERRPWPASRASKPLAPRVVRPKVAEHVTGELPEGTVVPASPRKAAILAAALTLSSLVVSFTGIGGRALTRSFPAGAVTVQGRDPAGSGPLRLDLGRPIEVRVRQLPPRAVGASEASLRFSVAGIAVGESGPEPLAQSGSERAAVLDGRGSRYVAAGSFTSRLDLLDDGGRTLVRHEFRARSARSGFLGLPGALAVVVLALVFAYAESLLRPLRRGRRRTANVAGMAVVGAGLGIVVLSLPLLLGVTGPTPVTLLTGLVLDAGAGLATAVAVMRASNRRILARIGLGPSD